MRVLHLIAGAGGMYCGSCLGGNELVGALRRCGVETILLPLYTPLRTEGTNYSEARIALGGINLFLATHRFARFLPQFARRLLDHPRLLAWIGRRAGTTRPELLGPICEAMLDDGFHRRHGLLNDVMDWINDEVRPDLIHLNNALLAGLTPLLKERLAVPVVASLSGEDTFYHRLPEPYRGRVKSLLKLRCEQCDGLAAMSRFYAEHFASEIGIPLAQIAVVPPGVDVRQYGPFDEMANHPFPVESDVDQAAKCVQSAPAGVINTPRGANPVRTIGFLGRICPEKGLHRLIEIAAGLLKLCAPQEGSSWNVVAAGYLSRDQRPYLRQCFARAAELRLTDRVKYLGELDRVDKSRFLRSVDLICLPSQWPESKAMVVYEAAASGTPVVLPAHGAFVELLRVSNGGFLYPPDDFVAAAGAIAQLIGDEPLRTRLGNCAIEWVRSNHDLADWAERTRCWYAAILADRMRRGVLRPMT